jgi:hypothetical protein
MTILASDINHCVGKFFFSSTIIWISTSACFFHFGTTKTLNHVKSLSAGYKAAGWRMVLDDFSLCPKEPRHILGDRLRFWGDRGVES